ncbi:MAG: hypothetical protein ABEJ31_06320 [Haloarculaceae archaeon]
MAFESDRRTSALTALRTDETTQGALPVKFGLLLGFAALAAAVAVAHGAPARGYELSIYDATPTAFWLAVCAAGLLALLGSAYSPPGSPTRTAALALAYGTALAVAALPILRGYRFFGAGDSLTHLGWVKDLSTGALSPLHLLYPGVHLSTLFVAAARRCAPPSRCSTSCSGSCCCISSFCRCA